MIVTSMSAKGFKQYGERAVNSWLKHSQFDITIYYEDDAFSEFADNPRVKQFNLYDTPGTKDFLEFISKNKRFRGCFETDDGKEYNYMYDAYKFSRKTFAVAHYGLETHDRDEKRFFWLDADVIAIADLPDNKAFLDMVLKGEYLSFLGRSWSYSECGFMAFDPKQQYNSLFMQVYRNFYLNGAFTVLHFWTDCHVFDATRLIVGAPHNNLSSELKTNHPFSECILANWFDHLKGPKRKELGHSPELVREKESA